MRWLTNVSEIQKEHTIEVKNETLHGVTVMLSM